MKNLLKGLTFLIIVGTCMVACNDETTEPTPTASAPTNLKYDPSTLSTDEGVAVESATPTVDGTAPITYTITTTPDAGTDITIDANTGVISATGATAGTFKVTVTATNTAGSNDFADALTVEVKEAAKVTFKDDIMSVITGSCAPCHVSGGGNTTYAEYAKAKAGVDGILNRINRMQESAGFMPLNGTKLDAATIALIEQWKTDGLLEE